MIGHNEKKKKKIFKFRGFSLTFFPKNLRPIKFHIKGFFHKNQIREDGECEKEREKETSIRLG